MDDVSLREYFEAMLAERDRRIDQRFAGAEAAVALALSARDKAIDKAEAQLEGWKSMTNEFRGQLKDQASDFALDKDVTLMRDRIGTIEGRFYGIALAATVLGAVALVVGLVR